MKLNQLRDHIHADNVVAGWWSDLKTGESIILTRNRPEMLMLVVSELSEADEAQRSDLKDDKLPHLPGFEVEIADAAIRLFDLCGAEGTPLDDHPYASLTATDGTSSQIMEIVNLVSRAMEGFRKGNRPLFEQYLRLSLLACFQLAEFYGFDLFDVIEQKRAYNRQRADHKVENRLKEGGKAF